MFLSGALTAVPAGHAARRFGRKASAPYDAVKAVLQEDPWQAVARHAGALLGLRGIRCLGLMGRDLGGAHMARQLARSTP